MTHSPTDENRPQPRLHLPAPDGVLNIDKPYLLSSTKALYVVRKLTGIRKSGHAGTLDPLADGVVLICLGRATKLVERLMALEKVYRAVARFDVTNAGYDAELPFEPVDVPAVPDAAAVEAAARGFVGRVLQTPPRFSAVKIRGKPAYKYAVKDKPVEIKPRPVDIYELRVDDYEWPEVRFTLRCGRGTYVRSLIRDWGRALGVGGCLTQLRRTRVGPFRAEDAYSLEEPTDSSPGGAFMSAEAVLEMLNAAEPDAGENR